MFVRSPLFVCCLWLVAVSSVRADEEQQSEKPTDAPETREVELAGITLQIPKSWKKQPPANNMRLAQFEVPALEGESMELAVFRFPSGAGAKAQVERWQGQFESAGRKSRIVQGKSRVGEYVFVDLSGTYKRSVGPPVLRRTKAVPNSRMLVAMFPDNRNGNIFLKLVGPRKSVDAQVDSFRTAFDAQADSEKPLNF